MRLVNNLRTVLLTSLIAGACGCHSAQKPATVVPPGKVPALQAAKRTPVPTQTSQLPASRIEGRPPWVGGGPIQPVRVNEPVGDVVSRAEVEYQTGLASYHAGKSDEAKEHFDTALNSLLSSNLDILSDARLENEFGRIVQGVNDLYPGGPSVDTEQAQEQQQKAEPAPIDETNGLAPSADARTKAKAEADIKNTHSDLPLMMTDQVAGYIAYFSNRGRAVCERAYSRSGRYRAMMLPILKEEGVPQDLIYLAQAESGFHPLAVSRGGARGIWQFMGSRR